MESLYKKYKYDDFEILAISNDPQGEEVVRPFVESTGLTYPILLDKDFAVNSIYLVRSLPTSFLVGRDGVVTHLLVGAQNWNDPKAHDLIEALLKART